MKVKYSIKMVVCLLVVCLFTAGQSQNTRHVAPDIIMGNATAHSGNNRLQSVVGQSLAPAGLTENQVLSSGILSSPIFRAPAAIIAAVTLDSLAINGVNELNFNFTLSGTFKPAVKQLRYRIAGQREYRSGELSLSENGYRMEIPPEFLTERGLEYYLLLSDGYNEITYPTYLPEKHPATIRIAVDRMDSKLTFQRRIHQMISVPLDLQEVSIFDLLKDDYGEYNTRIWRIFRYENDRYIEYPDMNAMVKPGMAFWLVSVSGNNFDIENGLSVYSANPYNVVLQPGWNQIGNPFAFPVSWDDMVKDSMVEPPVYYDGVEYVPGQDIMEPWGGYWVKNNSSGASTLKIPPVEAPLAVEKSLPEIPIDPEEEYLLQMIGFQPAVNLKDTYNYLGLLKRAQAHRDLLDISDPPVVGDHLRLTIKEGDEQYAANFKPVAGQGQQWDINISATHLEPVELILVEKGLLPEGFELFLLDEDLRYRIPVTDQQPISLQFSKDFPERRLKVILGTKAFAENNSDHISLIPLEYALAQNYPNPFNPETNIRYQLKQLSNVKLVIYNLLGQKIRTLVSGTQEAGAYQVKWDGRNQAGRKVASGIYIYRIRANEFIQARKMVFIH